MKTARPPLAQAPGPGCSGVLPSQPVLPVAVSDGGAAVEFLLELARMFLYFQVWQLGGHCRNHDGECQVRPWSR